MYISYCNHQWSSWGLSCFSLLESTFQNNCANSLFTACEMIIDSEKCLGKTGCFQCSSWTQHTSRRLQCCGKRFIQLDSVKWLGLKTVIETSLKPLEMVRWLKKKDWEQNVSVSFFTFNSFTIFHFSLSPFWIHWHRWDFANSIVNEWQPLKLFPL